MNILFVSHSFPRHPEDRVGSFILNLAKNLKDAGADVTVLAPHAPGLKKVEHLSGIKVLRFQYFWPASKACLAYEMLPNFRSSLLARIQVIPFFLFLLVAVLRRGRDFDIIHGHWAVAGLASILGAKIVKRPTMVTFRGSDINLGRNIWIVQKVLLFMLKNTDSVVTVSHALKKEVRKIHASTHVNVISNGINLDKIDAGVHFRPVSQKPGSNYQTILFAGALEPVKNIDTLLEAFQISLGRRPQLKLVIAGSGSKKCLLFAKAESLGIKQNVDFVGAVAPSQMQRLYDAADLFCLPSHSEGLPNVIIEAMLSGLPVVASNVGGVPELVSHGTNGYLCNSKDPVEFSESICKILGDQKLHNKMSENSRRIVLQSPHGIDTVVSRYLDIYARLLRHID